MLDAPSCQICRWWETNDPSYPAQKPRKDWCWSPGRTAVLEKHGLEDAPTDKDFCCEFFDMIPGAGALIAALDKEGDDA